MKFEQNPSTGSNVTHLQIKPNEFAVGVFRGDPLEFFVKWQQGQKPQPCEYGVPGAKFRFRLNFVIRDKSSGQLASHTWEQGATVYNQLKELHKDYPLDKTVVKITRHGSALDTTYSILPVPKGTVGEAFEEQLAAVKLNDLADGLEATKGKPPEVLDDTQAFPPDDFPPPSNPHDDLPF